MGFKINSEKNSILIFFQIDCNWYSAIRGADYSQHQNCAGMSKELILCNYQFAHVLIANINKKSYRPNSSNTTL